MRILLVRDRSGGADHAVLAARVDGRWMILDNRRGGPVQDRDASGLRPVFSIDEAGVGLVATRRMIPPGFDGR